MKRRTVLTMEQALSLSYATLRFAQLGWRVIRLEATPTGRGLPGDPNRYIGPPIAGDDRSSYFIAPNVGKEAIALDLKSERGRELLKTIIRELDVDVFCCNTLPSRYTSLGIDYETLCAVKPDLIWAAISAMGPERPSTPGYDPALQAMAGFMELTGDPSGPPTLAGVPVIDLKAGDEVYAGVCLALAERAETGRGRAIHVSMLQAAASWLITTLPLLDFDCDPDEVTRSGNEHRKFIPVNAYPSSDGFVFIAIGNDVQWERLVALEPFRTLGKPGRTTNTGRHAEREAIHTEMAAATRWQSTSHLAASLEAAKVPHAPILTIAEVRDLDVIAPKLNRTILPDGRAVHLPPSGADIEGGVTDFTLAPRYAEHTRAVLGEVGLPDAEIDALSASGAIAIVQPPRAD